MGERVKTLVDEVGLCVVNADSLRIRSCQQHDEENTWSARASNVFLCALVAACHCRKLEDVRGILHVLTEEVIFPMHNDQPFAFGGDSHSEETGFEHSTWNKLESLEGVVMGQLVKLNPKNAVKNTLATVGDYNPFSINAAVALKCCDRDGCECKLMGQLVTNLGIRGRCDPVLALEAFLRCMHHERASREGYGVVAVPLRGILLLCIDALSSVSDDIPQLSSFAPDEFTTDNDSWVLVLQKRIASLDAPTRGFVAMVHCYLLLSRHTPVTADYRNLVVGTSLVRLMYSTAEGLYYHRAHATDDVDRGQFTTYAKSYVLVKLMSSALVTAKSVKAWHSDGPSLVPLARLLSLSWQEHLPREHDLAAASDSLRSRLVLLDTPSELSKKKDFKYWSVRNIECYNPYGLLQENNKLSTHGLLKENNKLSTYGLGVAKMLSSGTNMKCNAFHVLTALPMATSLDAQHQSSYETNLDSSPIFAPAGRAPGLLTALVYRYMNSALATMDVDKKVSGLLEWLAFSRNAVYYPALLTRTHVPPKRELEGVSVKDPGNLMDLLTLLVFMPCQRPTLESPNLSAFALSQAELSLALSHLPDACRQLALVFFCLERITFGLLEKVGGSLLKEGNLNKITECPSVLNNAIRAEMVKLKGEREHAYQVYKQLFETLEHIVVDKDFHPLSIVVASKALDKITDRMDDAMVLFSKLTEL